MRKKAKVQKENNERWLLTYSDLITLLMVFFVVMFAISKADERKFAKFSASMQKALLGGVMDGKALAAISNEVGTAGTDALFQHFAGVRAAMEKLAQEQGVNSGVDVRLSREGIVVDLSGGLLFDSGKADLKPKAELFLDRLAAELRRLPNEVRVGGHTDNVPPNSPVYPTNWELSTARAIAVSRFLVEAGGIAPERIAAAGYGEFRPVADNDTRENRALNRRVEIVIVYPQAAELVPE